MWCVFILWKKRIYLSTEHNCTYALVLYSKIVWNLCNKSVSEGVAPFFFSFSFFCLLFVLNKMTRVTQKIIKKILKTINLIVVLVLLLWIFMIEIDIPCNQPTLAIFHFLDKKTTTLCDCSNRYHNSAYRHVPIRKLLYLSLYQLNYISNRFSRQFVIL